MPKKQGLGLGRVVTAAGLDILRAAGCEILALETMPENGKTLGMYSRLGLEPRYMTLLCQGTPLPALDTHFHLWRGDGALKHIGEQVVPGLDPTPAAQWLRDEQVGDTLVWQQDGVPVAFASLRMRPRREQAWLAYATLEVGACVPEVAAEWPRFLAEIAAYTSDHRKSGLTLPINARQYGLLRSALDAGLKIVHTRTRMVHGASLGGADDVIMLTLAM